MRSRTLPSLDRRGAEAACLQEEEYVPPRRRQSSSPIFRAAVESETVEQSVVFSQGAAGAGGPLAAGRYRR